MVKKITVQVTDPKVTNPRKIPSALFIENMEQFVLDHSAEEIMQSLQEVYNKYKVMEIQTQKSKEAMMHKVPEIERSLEIIKYLSKSRDDDIRTDFLMCDTVYVKAKIPQDVKTVKLWLGANTMVEFTFKEAMDLLTKNLVNAKGNLSAFDEDLHFLKDQITTVEVNIARCYNTNVALVRDGKLQNNGKELPQQ